MKKLLGLALVLALIATVGAVAEDMKAEMGNPKWFDLENCEFCKHLMDDPHLLENMTWEHHDISNGALSITTVKPEYRDAYKKAMAAMQALGEDMKNGKRSPMDVKMCGQCQAYGMLMMAGAKIEYVQSDAADVVLMTSNDEATVKKIHEFAEKNRTELAKWKAEQTAE